MFTTPSFLSGGIKKSRANQSALMFPLSLQLFLLSFFPRWLSFPTFIRVYVSVLDWFLGFLKPLLYSWRTTACGFIPLTHTSYQSLYLLPKISSYCSKILSIRWRRVNMCLSSMCLWFWEFSERMQWLAKLHNVKQEILIWRAQWTLCDNLNTLLLDKSKPTSLLSAVL